MTFVLIRRCWSPLDRKLAQIQAPMSFSTDKCSFHKTKVFLLLCFLQLQGNSLSCDMRDAFASNDFTDMTIVCDKREFHCHKFMLAARSGLDVLHNMHT